MEYLMTGNEEKTTEEENLDQTDSTNSDPRESESSDESDNDSSGPSIPEATVFCDSMDDSRKQHAKQQHAQRMIHTNNMHNTSGICNTTS